MLLVTSLHVKGCEDEAYGRAARRSAWTASVWASERPGLARALARRKSARVTPMSTITPGIPRTALPHEVLRAALEALDQGRRAVIASVLARHGSAPSTPGQKLALMEDGSAVGTIGGGAVERVVLGSMVKALTDPSASPRVETFRLGASLGMCCGGSVDILIEPMVPAVHALVIGAGHVGAFVAPLLASLGFRAMLCDAREEAMDPARIAALSGGGAGGAGGAAGEGRSDADSGIQSAEGAGVRFVFAEYDDPEVSKPIGAKSEAIAIVMTHDHMLDQRAIEWALEQGFGFVGGVGSRAKAARTRARLEAKGFKQEDIERVRMPLGVDIGARSPAEIGVSIAAELVAWRAARQQAKWRAMATVNPTNKAKASERAADGEATDGPSSSNIATEADA